MEFLIELINGFQNDRRGIQENKTDDQVIHHFTPSRIHSRIQQVVDLLLQVFITRIFTVSRRDRFPGRFDHVRRYNDKQFIKPVQRTCS